MKGRIFLTFGLVTLAALAVGCGAEPIESDEGFTDPGAC
jgi:hypothetical protein